MHRVTVTPLPATQQDEPIEVGSYWQSLDDPAKLSVVVEETPNYYRMLSLVNEHTWTTSEQNLRQGYTRLRNVRIEIEVQ